MSKAEKLSRIQAALGHRAGDRVPISDFFWTGFMKRARAIWGEDVDIYRKFDLDYIVINPNMDPHIQSFEILEDDGLKTRLVTGFGATVLRKRELPMPHYEEFSVKTPDQMELFSFDPPDDPRRFFSGGDDQLSGIGDTIVRDLPPWSDRVDAYVDDFPVFGSVCEGYEYVWRCIGSENALLWMLLEKEKFETFITRIGDFLVALTKAQIEAGRGRLSGMYIWGDVAYVNGMLFSPDIWREVFKPITERIIALCREAGLMTIYHGCGNATAIFDDYIEIGLDGYNPLEAKSKLDAVQLQARFGGRLALVGNIDVRELESGDKNRIKREVLYKLQAAENGGYIVQSDHSVTSQVTPESYAYMVELVREYGKFPLDIEGIRKEIG